MFLFKEADLREYAKQRSQQLNESFKSSLEKASAEVSQAYTIFLSHSFMDAEIVAGLYYKLRDMGYTVFVDWIDAPLLNRTNVNKKTAEALKIAMKNSRCLFYAHSEKSTNSRWMPWELGFFDGTKPGKVAILPITKTGLFEREEYLELYPYVEINTNLWIHNGDIIPFKRFDDWLNK